MPGTLWPEPAAGQADEARFFAQTHEPSENARGQQSSPFKVTINGIELPQDAEVAAAEFEFPRDYRDGERPDMLQEVDGWACEPLSDGNVVR